MSSKKWGGNKEFLEVPYIIFQFFTFPVPQALTYFTAAAMLPHLRFAAKAGQWLSTAALSVCPAPAWQPMLIHQN
jgi:hypothetical protein